MRRLHAGGKSKLLSVSGQGRDKENAGLWGGYSHSCVCLFTSFEI